LGGLPRPTVTAAVAAALHEDLGHGARDVTTEAVVPPGCQGEGVLAARGDICVAGLQLAEAAFHAIDPSISFAPSCVDGERVAAGGVLARVTGPAAGLLMAERVALNFLGRLSGIATATRRAVDAAQGTQARIAGTRKTTPGLRALETYALRQGGGINHRLGLDDGVLIKDNHLALAGGVTAAVTAARRTAGHMLRVSVEVETLEQLDAALAAGADAVLLDNMDLATLAEAVARIGGRAVAEASGGLTPERIAEVAATGVDVISLGWLTHSAPVADIGLDFSAGAA
jgi:nicotinate-nucleotide pyrophosphorylase (carboxylating)